MKTKILLLFCITYFLFNKSYAQETELPFSIEVTDVTPVNWPGLHSFAFAEWDDLWIVVGGRTNGLHGFFLATGFPVASANDDIWVMNHETGDIWTYDVNLLDDNLTEVLRATNGQYAQNGQYLYVTGGYGKSLATDEFETFPSLVAIDLSILVPAIVNETPPDLAFQQITDDRVKVCGGEMHKLSGDYYLVGGNDFSGRYTDEEEHEFVQIYTNEIRKFKISHADGELSITNYTAFESEENYHRRDFSLAPVIFPDASEGLALYGGVFRTDANLPYEHPVYISENDIQLDPTYAQKMSHYTCPIIPMYDAMSQGMYSILFGGISWHYYDHEDEAFIKDDLIPFIDDITVFVKRADGTSTEVVLPVQFDQYLGTNAVFIPNTDIPHYGNEVIQLDQVTERVLLGYIYGGIHAQLRNFTPSSASNRVFAIYMTPVTPLAVDPELERFVSSCEAGEVELKWSTSPYLMMDYFEIEYAVSEPINWTVLHKIGAESKTNYSWIDHENSQQKSIYYRLKRVQTNGSWDYSRIIQTDCNQENIRLGVVPNPAIDIIEVVFPDVGSIYHPIVLEISNSYGQIVQRGELSSDLKINVQRLSNGVYQLKLKTAKGTIGFGRFLKM